VALRVESARGWWSGSSNERTGFTSKSGGSPKAPPDSVLTSGAGAVGSVAPV
jgi:hypothetical protein